MFVYACVSNTTRVSSEQVGLSTRFFSLRNKAKGWSYVASRCVWGRIIMTPLFFLRPRAHLSLPRGGLRVFPSVRVGAAVLSAHGRQDRVLGPEHTGPSARLLHVRLDHLFGRKGEKLHCGSGLGWGWG